MERRRHCCNKIKEHWSFCHKKELLFEDRQRHHHCCYCMSLFYREYLRTKFCFQFRHSGQKYIEEVELSCECTPHYKDVVEFLTSIPTKSPLPIEDPTRYWQVQDSLRDSQLSPSRTTHSKEDLQLQCNPPSLLSQKGEGLLSKVIRNRYAEVEEREERDEQFGEPKVSRLNVIIPANHDECVCESCRLPFKQECGITKISGGRKDRQIRFQCWMCCIHQDIQQNRKIIELSRQVVVEQIQKKEHVRQYKRLYELLLKLYRKEEEKEEGKEGKEEEGKEEKEEGKEEEGKEGKEGQGKAQGSPPEKARQGQESGVGSSSDRKHMHFKPAAHKELTAQPSS